MLRDDRDFFPRYDAVLLMRASVDERPLAPRCKPHRRRHHARLNAQVEIDGRASRTVARDFLARGKPAAARQPGFLDRLLAPDLPRLLREHLTLVFASLAIAVAIGMPLGVLAHRRPRLAGG